MSSKKYSNRKQQSQLSANNGVVGLIMIVISVFFLLCISFSSFSVISRAIRNVILGLIGFSAYPFFLCMLFLGVAFLQNKRAVLPVKSILCIIGISFSLILLLQFITTEKYMVGVSEYIDSVYETDTVGGVLFGIIVYGISMATTKLLTYIFLGLIMAILILLLFSDIFSTKMRALRRNRERAKDTQKVNTGFVKGVSSPSPMRTVSDNSLFVDTIVSTESKTESPIISSSGSFDEIASTSAPRTKKYTGGRVEFQKYKNDKNDKNDIHKIFFQQTKEERVNRSNAFSPYAGGYDSQKNQYHRQISNYIPGVGNDPSVEREPEGKESPITDESLASKYGLEEIAVLPSSTKKDVKYVQGSILNGDEISEKLRASHSVTYSAPKTVSSEPYFGGANGEDSFSYTKNQMKYQGIINGDFYSELQAEEMRIAEENWYNERRQEEKRLEERRQEERRQEERRAEERRAEERRQEERRLAERWGSNTGTFDERQEERRAEERRAEERRQEERRTEERRAEERGQEERRAEERNDDGLSTSGDSIYSQRPSWDIRSIESSFESLLRADKAITRSDSAESSKDASALNAENIDNNDGYYEQGTSNVGQVNNGANNGSYNNYGYYEQGTSNVGQVSDDLDPSSASYDRAGDEWRDDQGSDFENTYDIGDDPLFFADDAEKYLDKNFAENYQDSGNAHDENDDGFEEYFAAQGDITDLYSHLESMGHAKQSKTAFEPEKTIKGKQPQTGFDNEDKALDGAKTSEADFGMRISEDVIDKSETSFDEKYQTGYYSKGDGEDNSISEEERKDLRIADEFRNKVGKIERDVFNKDSKSPITSQINIDDYLKSSAPKVEKPPARRKRAFRYVPPPVDLLHDNSTDPSEYGGDCEKKAAILEDTLRSLKFPSKVIGITRGPAVTRYEMETTPGIPIKRIENCAKDIAYALASDGKIRIETPIPGRRAVGVEVPNERIATVGLKEIISSKEFISAPSCLTLAVGKDITGNIIVSNLEKMPHLLIAGATGTGKSVCLNSIITSILYKSSPEDVRIILIDPKRVEFAVFKDMPHLLMKNIITEPTQVMNAFKWAKDEMERRYKLFSQYVNKNIQEFNNGKHVKSGEEPKLPYIVIIVDELSDLMMPHSNCRKELEDKIMSMAQKARAAGIHLILATQRPSVDVITGTIKANLPSRIAFAVTSIPDSRTILDQSGAEALLGKGDMLYSPLDWSDPRRVQGAFVTSEEVEEIVEYVKANNNYDFDEEAERVIMKEEEADENEEDAVDESPFDPVMKEALRRVIETGQASTSMMQRRFKLGYARAARIMDKMEAHKFVGPSDGAKPREVYITREQFREIFGEDV